MPPMLPTLCSDPGPEGRPGRGAGIPHPTRASRCALNVLEIALFVYPFRSEAVPAQIHHCKEAPHHHHHFPEPEP